MTCQRRERARRETIGWTTLGPEEIVTNGRQQLQYCSLYTLTDGFPWEFPSLTFIEADGQWGIHPW
jgi:hypothetical protein